MSPSSVRSGAPEPGTVIAGKYRIVKTLGTGGMGLVLAAHHLLLDQRIAIKCLSPAALEYPDIVERFTREARAAARIRSEHVARVIDVGEFDNGLPFIVLEYLEGEDLADHIQRVGPLRVSTAVRFLLEACEVLAEAHAAGIVHRDIKPANLFIAKQRDKRRIIKVLDFGISKLTDEPVTQASAMLGTVTYMSPEQLRSAKEVDHRTDIWALGAVLYECLSGVAAFGGTNTAELIASVFSNKPPSLRSLRDDLPDGLVEVVERCLRTDASERFGSVLEMATELAPFARTEDRASVDTIRRVTGASIAPASSGERNGGVPNGVAVMDDDGLEVTNTMPFSHRDLLADKPISSSGSATGLSSRSSGRISVPRVTPISGARVEPGSTTAPVEAPSTDARNTQRSNAVATAKPAKSPIATYVAIAATAAIVAILATRAMSSSSPAPAATTPVQQQPPTATTATAEPPPVVATTAAPPVDVPPATDPTTPPSASAAPTPDKANGAASAHRPTPRASASASAVASAPAASVTASASPPIATTPAASGTGRAIDKGDPWSAH